MADKLIGGLTPTAAVVLTDKVPKEPTAGPPAEYFLISQLKTLLDTIYAPITGGAYVLKTGDSMSGLLTIAQATANTSALVSTGYSLTGANAQSLMSLAGTLNTSGNPSVLRLAVTDTASGATTKLLELLAGAGGATSMFSVSRLGSVFGARDANFGGDAFNVSASSGLANLYNGGGFSWDVAAIASNNTPDLVLRRDGAGILAQRNAANAQALRWYRTYTNSTNYERGALQTAAGQIILAAETAGTGTDDIDLVLTPAGTGNVTLPGGVLLKTVAALTNGAAAALATITNGPAAGNPTKWVPINDAGTTRYIPCW